MDTSSIPSPPKSSPPGGAAGVVTAAAASVVESPDGRKQFPCDFCGKVFYQQSRFVRHYMTHTGERPFVCTICGKGFTQRVHLQRHHMMHRNRDAMPPEDDVNGASNGNTSAGGKPADATGGAILAIDAVEFPGDGANSKTNESNDGDGIIKKAVNGVAKSEVNGAANGSSSEGAAKSGAGSKKEFGAHSGTMKKMMTEAGEVVMVDMDNGKDEEDKKEDNQPCFPGEKLVIIRLMPSLME